MCLGVHIRDYFYSNIRGVVYSLTGETGKFVKREHVQALETVEASSPRLWHDMATARHLTASFLSRRRAA